MVKPPISPFLPITASHGRQTSTLTTPLGMLLGTHDNYSTPYYINSSVEITAARWSAARRNAIFKDSATRERCRRYTFWCALDVVIGLDRSYSCRTTRLNQMNLVGQNFLWSRPPISQTSLNETPLTKNTEPSLPTQMILLYVLFYWHTSGRYSRGTRIIVTRCPPKISSVRHFFPNFFPIR